MKPKVYLDTSVISHLAHEDAPEKMSATRELWRLFQESQFDIALSVTTLYELDKCPDPPKSTLFDFLAQIKYETYEMTFAVESIADLILSMGILRKKATMTASTLHLQSPTNVIILFPGISNTL